MQAVTGGTPLPLASDTVLCLSPSEPLNRNTKSMPVKETDDAGVGNELRPQRLAVRSSGETLSLLPVWEVQAPVAPQPRIMGPSRVLPLLELTGVPFEVDFVVGNPHSSVDSLPRD